MSDRDPVPQKLLGAKAGFLGINSVATAGSIFLVHFFQTPSIMVVNAIPIILCGWLFGRFHSFWSALLLFVTNGVYFKLTGQEAFVDPKGLFLGIVSYGIFSGAGFALRSVRDLYEKIHVLNAEINRKNLELRESSLKDPLTDLHNRRYVDEYIAELATTFLRQISTPEFSLRNLGVDGKVILVMIADIDHFKLINDSFGHGAGDQALVEVSRRIKDSVRFDDTVIRWGGEEFLIVCPMVDKSNAELVLKKVLDGVRTNPVVVADGTSTSVTISLGAIWLPVFQDRPLGVSFERAILLADHALYEAKCRGRNHGRLLVAVDPGASVQGSLEDFHRDGSRCKVRVVA